MASIAVTSPSDGDRVSGTVDVTVRVSGGSEVGEVTVVIGLPEAGTRTATRVRDREYRVRWDTTRKLVDPDVAAPSDALFWITARAEVDGVQVDAPHVAVTTANRSSAAGSRAAAGGWRPELAWAADYSGSTERWRESHAVVVGSAYAEVQDDPVLGAARRVVAVSVPNSAKRDEDQPTDTTVRFQSSSPRTVVEGDEFCVGFAFLPPPDFPTVFPDDDPTNPGDRATGYIALFQFYGPPYEQGSPFVLHANRRTVDDPVDEFAVRGNELNPGDPVAFLALPYRRGRWTDVVFRVRASSSIEEGWVETYVNQGESTAVRPVQLTTGTVRLPRVLLRPDSEPFRTDLQLYRVNDRFDRVSVLFTGHRIAETVEEADPRSYRDGVLA
ncbi:Ig-like domain-containing protein [Modestobacter versicolor]|uniref:Uncharacterized protein n=1 Tax=Modestobacter versicolor TaxID=429133 RepID=A0A323VDH1_9ACTN|nr:Ig-like domain-containing protein [Modestobacter versicolor]MBB3676981.1 hypothetical protein [Modestobacter versicolor]PZA22894.1 hypothetical protein DMO24_02850 [Modestobacter versicolor]